MKIFKILLVSLFLIILFPNQVLGQDDVYRVFDAKNEEIYEEFDNLRNANSFYNEVLEQYDNAVLIENDKVLKMEYGIVKFNTSSKCDLSIDYFSTSQNDYASINGCYGIDSAYIDTSNSFNEITFIQ